MLCKFSAFVFGLIVATTTTVLACDVYTQQILKAADAFERAFVPNADQPETWLLLTDFPTSTNPAPNDEWKDRAQFLSIWKDQLQKRYPNHKFEIYGVPFSGQQNADIPATAYRLTGSNGEFSKSGLATDELLSKSDIVIAASEYSMTAPLGKYAKKYPFRAATMPGFNARMLSALNVDFLELAQRTGRVQKVLDLTQSLDIVFKVSTAGRSKKYSFHVDLRNRVCTTSNCKIDQKGTVSNMPSGETFIVPYEGELDESLTRGFIPIQIDGELVIYKVEGNKTVEIIGDGPAAKKERVILANNPGYANIAEIGFGVLRSMGVEPLGNEPMAILLNEKLALHIAWGRSDHFKGGTVGTSAFNGPAIHLDRIFIRELMPRISVVSVKANTKKDKVDQWGKNIQMITNDEYTPIILNGSTESSH